jgi:hypothetical protein
MNQDKHFGPTPKEYNIKWLFVLFVFLMLILFGANIFVLSYHDRLLTEIYEIRMNWDKPKIWNLNYEDRRYLVDYEEYKKKRTK